MLRAIPNRSRGWIIAVKLLAEAGAEIREITLPALQDFSACGQIILAAEAYAVHEQWLKERPEDYGARARERLLAGPTLRAVDYLQAVRWRLQLRDRGSEGLCGHRPGDNRLEHGSRLPH
jgi:aspartyl-tRNA(Asn)/glutamyl-tRNA(Gln) amidotransferase subunit A